MKYLRRGIWFVASRLLLICLILGLMITVFYYAMNLTNIQIILKDGMAKRAQVVMMGESESALQHYFSAAYIGRDALLGEARSGQNAYQQYYSITGFDHRIDMNWVWCWPWEDTARATVTERIPRIDGKVKASEKAEAQEAGFTSAPPKWQSAQYSVLLSRENGRWIIKNMTQTEVINE